MWRKTGREEIKTLIEDIKKISDLQEREKFHLGLSVCNAESKKNR